MTIALLAFSGVGLQVFCVAAVALFVLVLALLAAAANVFFRSVARYDDALREATMDLSPADRRRFYALYDSRRPKSPAVAWFLAVGLGPIGTNLYRGNVGAFLGALVTFNGLGAWWMESWFTAPQLVSMANRDLIEWTFETMRLETEHAPPPSLRLLKSAS